MRFGQFKPDRSVGRSPGSGPSGARLGALLFHRSLETGNIHPAPLFAQCVLRQVQRKAIGVVKFERSGTGQLRSVRKVRKLVIEQPEAAVERLLESGLFAPERFRDQRLRPA